MLQDETEGLEDKKSELQQEIQILQQQRDELEFLLATHKANCRRIHSNNNSISTTTSVPTTTSTSLHQAVTMPVNSVIVKEEPMDDDFLQVCN